MASSDRHNEEISNNLQPGDLIEIFRPAYQHWALYLGDGYVINVAPMEENTVASFSSAKSVFSRKALIKMQLLKDVVGNDTYKVNNKYDDKYTPLSAEEIIQRAEIFIGQEICYDLLGNNCEHFVTLLRYGEAVSDQLITEPMTGLSGDVLLVATSTLKPVIDCSGAYDHFHGASDANTPGTGAWTQWKQRGMSEKLGAGKYEFSVSKDLINYYWRTPFNIVEILPYILQPHTDEAL